MNIFVSDYDPVKSAINLDDKRVRHMPKECLEMLRMAIHRRIGITTGPFIIWGLDHRLERFKELYDHPCTKWVAEERANMWWLWRHTRALHHEFRHRTNRQHWLEDATLEISHYVAEIDIEPKNFRDSSGFSSSNLIKNYRDSLNRKWLYTDYIRPVKWTRRTPPSWFEGFQTEIEFELPDERYSDDYEDDDLPF